jgi:Ca-activated chloride channel family protein
MRIASRSFFRQVISLLFALFWVAACAALARPVLPQVAQRQTIETRDIVIQTDISGSMNEPVERNVSLSAPPHGNRQIPTRIAAARDAVADFVRERTGDRIALLLFNDESFYCWPLSRDLEVVERRVRQIDRYVTGGTNFDSPNGAIQGAIDHIREMSEAQTRVLILVTDGEAFLDRRRSDELVRQILELNIRVYVLGVGQGWLDNSSLTRDLRRIVEAVNGSVIPIGNDAQMRAAFATINQLERSSVQIERSVTYLEIYGLLAGAAAILLLCYLAFGALFLEDA